MNEWKKNTRQLLDDIFDMITRLRKTASDKQEKTEMSKILDDMGMKFEKFFGLYDRAMNSEMSFFFTNDIDEVDAQFMVDILEMCDFSIRTSKFPQEKYSVFFDDFKFHALVSFRMRENEKMYNDVKRYSELNNAEAKEFNKELENIHDDIVKVQTSVKKFHETSISILGFFTAIVFTVFGGLDMISKIFDKVVDPSGSNIALLILSGVMIFLVMLLTVNFLLVTIGKLSGNNHNDFKYNVSFKKINYEISYVRVLFYLSLIISVIIFALLGVNKFHKDSNAMVFDFILLPMIVVIMIITVIIVIKIFMKNKKSTN